MALARIDKPAVVIYSGPMRAGRWHGERATIQEVWEAVGARRQGKLERAELDELERSACPGPGHLRRALHREHDGAGARVPRARRRRDHDGRRRRARAARASSRRGGVVSPCGSRRGRPRRPELPERRSLLNAFAGIAASGGSTNGVLHLLAIAREAGVELTIDDLFERARGDADDRQPHARRPLRRHRLPGGRRRAGPDPRADPRGPRRRRRAGRRRRHARRRRRRTPPTPTSASRSRRTALQGIERAPRPAREPRPRRRGRQGLRHRAPQPHRPGARVRQRGRLHRCDRGRARSSPATS